MSTETQAHAGPAVATDPPGPLLPRGDRVDWWRETLAGCQAAIDALQARIEARPRCVVALEMVAREHSAACARLFLENTVRELTMAESLA